MVSMHALDGLQLEQGGRSALPSRLSLPCTGPEQLASRGPLPVSKRALLLTCAPLPLLQLGAAAPVAAANPLEAFVRGTNRPDLSPQQATVLLLDAQGTLSELKALAATAPDSHERFVSRALLPGWAKRLRQVGMAAPVAAAVARGVEREATVSALYGGASASGASAATDAVYAAIGNVVTISGRTIRPEAQASPAPAEAALARVGELLAELPPELVAAAQDARVQQRAQRA